ncbi:hypothetical protein ACWGOE_01510 [Leucobacter chromiiresistens]
MNWETGNALDPGLLLPSSLQYRCGPLSSALRNIQHGALCVTSSLGVSIERTSTFDHDVVERTHLLVDSRTVGIVLRGTEVADHIRERLNSFLRVRRATAHPGDRLRVFLARSSCVSVCVIDAR